MLAEMMMFLAAVLAGTGGAMAGVKVADAVNRMLGREAPANNKVD